jgi:transcriptional regulator with XRE-family HTH domain
MSTAEPPAVARRRVRLALRAAREATGFTQGHVAEELDWSISKVNRIEKGDVTVSRTDLLALLELYEVTDQELIQDLVRAARTSRQRGWWDEPRFREHLRAPTLQLFQFESEATTVRVFQNTLVPGVLQTREYAEFVIGFWNHSLTETDRAARFEARMARREHFLGLEDPADYLLILDESVLHREVGGARIMAAQLRELLEICRARPSVRVRVLPLAAAAILAMLGPFTLFDLGDEENAVLYREGVLTDEILHSGEIIRHHRMYFEQMWERSLGEEASDRLIEARAMAMLSDLDRQSIDPP